MLRKLSALLIIPLALLGCEATPPEMLDPLAENFQVTDLEIVDCMLPGVIRRLGNTSYLSAGRPIRTTAANCRTRGGEYTAFDRADYRTALSIWLGAAEAGDPEAQTNVGEIFERGHGGDPNYVAAATWYARAASQGNTRAQFNLGTLYEQGLGVEQDKLKALNLYRQAWGMAEDDILYQSVANAAQASIRADLEQELKRRDRKIQLLTRQIEQLELTLNRQTRASEERQQLAADLADLQKLVSEFKQEQSVTRFQIAQSQQASGPPSPSTDPILTDPGSTQPPAPITRPVQANERFGNYYALIIGIQEYGLLKNLTTPSNDVREVANLLENRYGFSVRTLVNASNVDIMQAINELGQSVGAEDNLLVYFAGHGSRVQIGEFENGFWLPMNADPPPTDTFWVSNEFITRHLGVMKAKRVLIVSDSCYADLLSSAPSQLFLGMDKIDSEKYLEYKLAKRSRLLLASGTDRPITVGTEDNHSVFARAFIKTLTQNKTMITGPDLYREVNRFMMEAEATSDPEQKPKFKAIKGAGHEVGDFFFIPQSI